MEASGEASGVVGGRTAAPERACGGGEATRGPRGDPARAPARRGPAAFVGGLGTGDRYRVI